MAAFVSGALAAQHHTFGLAQPVDLVANGAWYGAGCGGNGQPVTITATPGMRPGMVSRLRIEHLPPGQTALLLLGSSAQDWWGTPLPLALGGLGMNGCELLVAAEMPVVYGTGSGTAVADIRVPALPQLAAQPLFVQTMFHQPSANAAGVGMSRGYATRIAPFATPTSSTMSISQHGITFTFAAPVEAGRFVNGDWFVVGPVTITAMSPPSALVNGRVVHGAMVDPDPSTQNQGYDSTLFDPQHYSHGRNAAWGLSPQNPLVLPPNHSLIKAISNFDPAHLPALKTCSVLTVLDSVPPEGSFRPAYAGSEHAVRYDVQMIDWQRLLSLTPAPGMPNLATAPARFERPWLDHAPGWATRYLHPVDNMPDYGRDLASDYNEAVLMCHTDAPLAAKQALAVHLVQIGIDFFGNVEGGAFWEGVGGHGSGRKLPILFAGALLGDHRMLAVGADYPSGRNLDGTYTMHFGEDCQTFYVEETAPGVINWGFGGYQTQHLGMPEFGFSHTHYPDQDVLGWTTNSYRLCCTANAWIGAVLAARMMDLVDAWQHPALFDYTDRYATTEPPGWTRTWSPWVGGMWDLYRPQF
ncbi:MAG TPA: hypothetical protein ENI87_10595 [bacterium]|nr:hypothetical protein [bacterium]